MNPWLSSAGLDMLGALELAHDSVDAEDRLGVGAQHRLATLPFTATADALARVTAESATRRLLRRQP